MREQIARNRVGTTDEGMNQRHFPAHERQDLVNQLEASREQVRDDHTVDHLWRSVARVNRGSLEGIPPVTVSGSLVTVALRKQYII